MVIGVALLLLGSGLLLFTFWPVGQLESQVRLKSSLEGLPGSPLQSQVVQFFLPEQLPAGLAELVEMTVQPATGLETTAPVQWLEAQLELSGAELFPAERVRAPYAGDRPVTFRWLVTARSAPVSGRAWLAANLSTPFDANTSQVVLARPMELEVRSLAGLDMQGGRWLGGGLIGLGGLFGWLPVRFKRSGRAVKR